MSDSKDRKLKPASGPSLSESYNASQLRADTWNKLKAITLRLDADGDHGRPNELLLSRAREALDLLEPIEAYWAFPGLEAFGHLRRLLSREDFVMLSRAVSRIVRALMSGSYRRKHVPLGLSVEDEGDDDPAEEEPSYSAEHVRPYFEVLVVDNVSPSDARSLRHGLHAMRRPEDRFIYEAEVVPSFEDGLIGVLFNHNIQSVVVRYGFPTRSRNRLELLQRYLSRIGDTDLDEIPPEDYGVRLAELIGRLRPELDVYLVTDQMVKDVAGRVTSNCRRVFYNTEDYMELHLNILRGVNSRFETPFFTALKEYSKQPTGVFHAMPISRGKSIAKSNWIRDMGDFYGMNIFLAETSATSGGLDSLLDPHGPIKKAQEMAARAFGARQPFFATNGTSTCNKIVVQALVRPGDIVLVDRDCHKSHHYGMVLAGAHVVYLDSYPLSQYSMYGAVPLREIKRQLLDLKAAGKLHRVKMLLLTNCTFDGIVYNVERVMEECLAIKPDLVFLWDEAWFGFARFGPAYRQRTAMHAANVLRQRFRSESYRARYKAWVEDNPGIEDADIETLERTPLLPDPDAARVRVYATQSTHKTLTALLQGSMIHINDQDYKSKVEEPFHEAYMTHTSTSPNYQILASLDVGRRQVELEGFELVQKQVETAMALREKLHTHPLLTKYFKILTVGDLVPEEYRQSGISSYYDRDHGWNDIWDAWAHDEFTLDATRLTLLVGGTGLDGDTFKNDVLMDR
jgi:arginine decarboxylase